MPQTQLNQVALFCMQTRRLQPSDVHFVAVHALVSKLAFDSICSHKDIGNLGAEKMSNAYCAVLVCLNHRAHIHRLQQQQQQPCHEPLQPPQKSQQPEQSQQPQHAHQQLLLQPLQQQQQVQHQAPAQQPEQAQQQQHPKSAVLSSGGTAPSSNHVREQSAHMTAAASVHQIGAGVDTENATPTQPHKAAASLVAGNTTSSQPMSTSLRHVEAQPQPGTSMDVSGLRATASWHAHAQTPADTASFRDVLLQPSTTPHASSVSQSQASMEISPRMDTHHPAAGGGRMQAGWDSRAGMPTVSPRPPSTSGPRGGQQLNSGRTSSGLHMQQHSSGRSALGAAVAGSNEAQAIDPRLNPYQTNVPASRFREQHQDTVGQAGQQRATSDLLQPQSHQHARNTLDQYQHSGGGAGQWQTASAPRTQSYQMAGNASQRRQDVGGDPGWRQGHNLEGPRGQQVDRGRGGANSEPRDRERARSTHSNRQTQVGVVLEHCSLPHTRPATTFMLQ